MSIRQINPEVKTVHLVKNALSHVTLDNSHKHCGTQAFSRISKISLDAWKKKIMFEFQSSVFVCLLYINTVYIKLFQTRLCFAGVLFSEFVSPPKIFLKHGKTTTTFGRFAIREKRLYFFDIEVKEVCGGQGFR